MSEEKRLSSDQLLDLLTPQDMREILKWELDRLDHVANFKQKFGREPISYFDLWVSLRAATRAIQASPEKNPCE